MEEELIEKSNEEITEPVKELVKEPTLTTSSIDLPIDDNQEEKVETVPETIIEPSRPIFGLNDKLEGDDVPVELKGKSVNDLINIFRESQQPSHIQTVPTREEQMTELRNTFYQDPIGSVAKMIELTIAPIMEDLQGTKTEKAVGGIASLPDYELLKPDIDEFMSNVPTNLKANPQSWQIAYERAKGKNFDKLVEMRLNSSVKKQIPVSLPKGTGTVVESSSINLTNEEKAVAKAFNLTEKEYAKWR